LVIIYLREQFVMLKSMQLTAVGEAELKKIPGRKECGYLKKGHLAFSVLMTDTTRFCKQ